MSEAKEEQTHVRDDDLWDEFWQAGNCSGSIARDCRHGTTFFHDDECAGDFYPGELEKLRENAKANPQRYRALSGDGSFTEQLGFEWCWDCQKCRAEALKYQTFLWANRWAISSFLNARLNKEAERAADEKARLTIQKEK